MNFISKIFRTKQFEIYENSNGNLIFGGIKPENFKIPENDFLGNFQYLGYIPKDNKYFSWLPFSLHLICPILTDFDYIFLDYNDSNNPKLLYPTNSEKITSAYSEINKESIIEYESKRFDIREFDGINEDNEFEIFGVTGKPQPNFEDEPVIYPNCPINNKKMKFVVQLFSNEHIKTANKNFISESDYEEKIHQHMNFWCDGSIKIFIEPSSKIVALTIQNT
jgi:hypothetical protein